MAKRILVQAGVHGPHPDGQYVRYEDYAALREDAKKLATLLFKSVKGEELTDREKAAGVAFLCNGELND